MMLLLTPDTIRSLVSMPNLVDCLADAFSCDCVVPPRQISAVPGGDGSRLFVSMPAFHPDGGAAIKLVTIFPDNDRKGLPNIQAIIIAFSEDGAPVAVLDGTVITYLRTGAASALASRYLSRPDSSHLVVVGTGALAPAMAAAHCAVRPIKRVSVWGRRPERAAVTAAIVRTLVKNIEVTVPPTLEDAVTNADIVSCATSSPTPVLAGKWLRPGSFIDLVGSFSPTTREADDEVVLRSRIFVDTREGALAEAGDVIDPIKRGVIAAERVEGDLSDLVRGQVKGRKNDDEIIMFKSVGTAIEDLAAAGMIVAASNENTRK